MEGCKYIIDRNPDTVIILRNPCTVFAPWDTVDESAMSPPPKGQEAIDSAHNEGPEEDLSEQIVAAIEASFISSIQDDTERDNESLPESQDSVQSADIEFHYHVSSRHLILASSWFDKAMTEEGFVESNRDKRDGLFHINAQDWDAEAFFIVLCIVHGRNKLVEREITLEMLAKIAVLEDYYGFGETLDVFKEVWIGKLNTASMPKTYGRDMILLMWVAWVFNLEQQFVYTTAEAVRQSTEPLRTLGLPIPAQISDAIDSKRCHAIEALVERLHRLAENYRDTNYKCPQGDQTSFQCGSFLLGAVVKGMSDLGLYQPRPEAPFPGLSFRELCTLIKGMKSPRWWNSESSRHYNPHHSCTLESATVILVSDVSDTVKGLDLSVLKTR